MAAYESSRAAPFGAVSIFRSVQVLACITATLSAWNDALITRKARGRLSDRAGIGRNRDDHEHQEKGQRNLEHERVAIGTTRQGRAEARDITEESTKQHRRQHSTQQLCRPIPRHESPRQVSTDRERERHGRIEMRAGDVTGCVDHRHDDQTEGDRDSNVPQRARFRIDDDCTAPGKDESEGANRLRHQHAQLI